MLSILLQSITVNTKKEDQLMKNERFEHGRFTTPNELAKTGLISLVKQWEERKRGRLKCYRIGAKVLYGQKHIQDYLELCEISDKVGGAN